MNAKTLSDWAYIAVDKHFHKILAHEAGVLKDEDQEELHQMRVGTRRLRSALAGFSPALELPRAANDKSVGKLARILGGLRDLDVLKESLVGEYLPHLPGEEQRSLSHAFKYLEQERKKVFKTVDRTLKDNLYIDLKNDFKNWLNKPQYGPMGNINIEPVLPELLLPQVSKFLLHQGWLIGANSESFSKGEVENILSQEGHHLHELRKEAKHTRYNMELFAQFYDDTYDNYLDDVKKLQTVLGNIQDSSVLSEFLGEVYGQDLRKKMPTLIGIFQNIHHENWQKWQKLQAKYLRPDTRRGFHLTIVNHKLIH
ncbi:MAG: hypothetical protein N5P05_001895 [Chroococcopsis gigantea SAG 12.99]|jgi:CHAD domain-containing protein|nr:CHAD domain-containing protein [Chlorogloea purpurea SAG 13.99]MDV3000289.1 hypothetical protein [Chroococcopsis gigantea SAG 12.99]